MSFIPSKVVFGVTFYAFKPGDRVRVAISGRTGTIVKRCKPRHDGWMVAWDTPMYGVTEGRVAWPNLEPAWTADELREYHGSGGAQAHGF